MLRPTTRLDHRCCRLRGEAETLLALAVFLDDLYSCRCLVSWDLHRANPLEGRARVLEWDVARLAGIRARHAYR
eukprot:22065-Amorphochlora_amoeboformis.AAC.1